MRISRISRIAACIAFALWFGGWAIVGTTPPSAAEAFDNPLAGREDLVPRGKTLFNLHCSHCHGPNAYQAERRKDLRRLRLRYGTDTPMVFYKTATIGREPKGMPSWKDILEDDSLWKIFTFLETVQK